MPEGRHDHCKGLLYWETAIGIQDIGERPLEVDIAESGDRNALGQNAASNRNQRIVIHNESPAQRPLLPLCVR
jgi:hypothetical protein